MFILSWLTSLLSLTLGRTTAHFSAQLPQKSHLISNDNFDWNLIPPDVDLIWYPCYQGFECARLDLPLDWLDPEANGTRVALAVIKWPASDLDNYRGSIFTNPGGPGGSGIESLKLTGRYLQTIVGKNYDLISFDPRGVGSSTPVISCLPTPQQHKIWDLLDVGVIDSHPGVLYDAFARATAFSQSCAASTGPIRFVSTTSVARDMLELMHKMGFEKIQYWGFSYGTVLGGVFAAMWPDKIERMVLDGNVDLHEWTRTLHAHFLEDADKVMSSFFHFCHLAGPTRCAFYAATPDAISTRLDSLLERLRSHPLVVPSPSSAIWSSMALPEVVYYSNVKRLIATAMYRPIYLFPKLAQVLEALERGDGAPFVDLVTIQGLRRPFSCNCESCAAPQVSDSSEDVETHRWPNEQQQSLDAASTAPTAPAPDDKDFDSAFATVLCTDGTGMNDTVEEFETYALSLQNMSRATGAVNIYFRLACAGWTVKAKWRFDGPFTANTSHPILMIANKADNVTPLRSALNNSAGFPGSRVLVLDSHGHTSLAAPSLCMAKHVRSYFNDGVLPPPETLCEVDMKPFLDVFDVEDTRDRVDVERVTEQEELDYALRRLASSRTMPWDRLGGLAGK